MLVKKKKGIIYKDWTYWKKIYKSLKIAQKNKFIQKEFELKKISEKFNISITVAHKSRRRKFVKF